MRAEDLESGTVPELAYGTVFTGPNGQRLILGDTDTVAYQDADGAWQVAENVVWDRVEFFADAMEGARQRDHHRTLTGYGDDDDAHDVPSRIEEEHEYKFGDDRL